MYLPTVIRWLLGIWLVVGMFSQVTMAIPMGAEVTGDKVRWLSAQSSSMGGLAPSIWYIPSRLTPAVAFTPGGITSTSSNVILSGGNGDRVTLNLQLFGMEYTSPEATHLTNDSGGGNAQVSLSGALIQVEGFTLGNQKVMLKSAQGVSPFTHARPVFSLGDAAEIVDAFKNAKASSGTYTGQVIFQSFYDYENVAGVRVRYNWSLPVEIEIKYSSSMLSDVQVSSPSGGVITPRYYTVGGIRKVSGDVTFNVVATGYFSNGLNVLLKKNDSYTLVGPASSNIPFSVVCSSCSIPLLVDTGVAAVGMDTVGTHITGTGNSIYFPVHVGFKDIEMGPLNTGAYQGFFSLLFEPDV